jgi:hypothetical protein
MSRRKKLRKQRPPSVYLPSTDTVRAILRERLATREWWVFVSTGTYAVPFLTHLERVYYPRRFNSGFETMAVPFAGLPTVSLALAKKSHLSVRQLATYFDAAGEPRQAEEVASGERDVLFLSPSVEANERLKDWFVRFLLSGDKH